MAKILIFFRNYLHRKNLCPKLTKEWVKTVDDYFKNQNLDLNELSFQNIADILKLQSVFNKNFLKLYRGNSSPLFYFGNFLVGQSFLSENPAEKVWKIPAVMDKINNYHLREFDKGRILKSPTLVLPLIRIAPIFASLTLFLFFFLNFLIPQQGLIKTKRSIKNNPFRVEITKKIYAKSKNNYLDFEINLNNEEKIVSSSAKIMIKNKK